MKQLETKYTTAMRDKADLTDSKEQLEHLIMQLQGETETIGKKTTTFLHRISAGIEHHSQLDSASATCLPDLWCYTVWILWLNYNELNPITSVQC